ncbi:hypothetical protein KU90_12735 [Salmonella enterica subsp. enterica serovar Heidelberg]|jgi:hypothetical protein|nr:hypothetical protein [Salmonella enterica subsp. enterica serovar Heidelberg]
MGSNIIELAKLGHERAAELKASCGAVDVRSLAQLISDLATQLEVQFVRSTNMAVQLANAESKRRELAAEISRRDEIFSPVYPDENTMNRMTDVFHDTAKIHCDEDSIFVDNAELVITAIINHYIKSEDAFLAEVRAQGVTEYATKRGFSFQHGSIHAHFGNGDVMVGATKFENGHAGICFAPVREKEGGVGTEYKWTEGKNTEQVDSVFVISSSNIEGLEVIQGKLSEAITQLRQEAAQ